MDVANVTTTTPISPSLGGALEFATQRFSVAFYAILISILGLIYNTVRQPAFPKNAPTVVKGWPILGAVELFNGKRTAFLARGIKQSATRNFSTYIGKHQVLSLSGTEGRKFFFESKALDLGAGNRTLLTATPTVGGRENSLGEEGKPFLGFDQWFSQTLIKMLRRETFNHNLPLLISDASSSINRILELTGRESGVMDPYDHLYRLVYLLTMRQIGPKEIAEDEALIDKTLYLFGEIEAGSSTTRIIFPWLPTLGGLRQKIAGARMYAIFKKIADQRQAEGRKEKDSFQYLLDTGAPLVNVLGFVVGSLYAGLVNSGINAAFLLAALATNKDWYQRVRSEVDAAIQKHRTSPSQTPFAVLATLDVEDWEAEFPAIDLGLREAIRFNLVGSGYRQNTSGADVPIGASGEIVPRDAYVMYQMDDLHFDPAVYTDPGRFDPGRYLPERAEDRKVPLGYAGWGVARHPCLGMRFAKLEMAVIVAMFSAMFDWEYLDGEGRVMTEAPVVDRDRLLAHKPAHPVRLRYTVRKHSWLV